MIIITIIVTFSYTDKRTKQDVCDNVICYYKHRFLKRRLHQKKKWYKKREASQPATVRMYNDEIKTRPNTKTGFENPSAYFGNACASQVLSVQTRIYVYCCDDNARGSIQRDGEKRHRPSPSNTTRVYVMCMVIILCECYCAPSFPNSHMNVRRRYRRTW